MYPQVWLNYRSCQNKISARTPKILLGMFCTWNQMPHAWGLALHLQKTWLGCQGFIAAPCFSAASGLSEAFLTCTSGVRPTRAFFDTLLAKEGQLGYGLAPEVSCCVAWSQG